MPHARTLAPILCGLLTYSGGPQALQQSTLGDIRIPQQPSVDLELPALDPVVTAGVIERVLTRADVLFGLEVVPPPHPNARPDFGRRVETRMQLNGLSVKKALDAIVAADPRYLWEERDGRIIVRAASATSVLQMPIGRLTITNASLADALKAIVARLDPSVTPSVILGGVVMGTGDSVAEATLRRAPLTASVTLENPTLIEALNSVGRQHQVSWKVRYEPARMDAAAAAVSFLGGGQFLAAVSPHAARADRASNRTPRLTIPILGDIATMIQLYASRVRVQYGVDLVPERVEIGPRPEYPPLDLTGLPPSEGLSRILELDSRYEWFESGGLLNVRPRRTVVARTLLDREVDGFSAADELLENILLRLVVSLGAREQGRNAGQGGADPAVVRQKMEQALRRPLSFSIGRATVRDVLNALCRADGTLSWVMQPQPDTSGNGVFVMFKVDSFDGWSVGRNFRITRW